MAVLTVLAACNREEKKTGMDIIPVPGEIIFHAGACDIRNGIEVTAADSVLQPAAVYLKEALEAEGVTAGGTMLTLSLDSNADEDSYRLLIDGNGISISGGSYCSVINGTATLRQIIWTSPDSLPALEISDSPRFAWRGVMLDVSRHFFTADEVRSLIDRMALYKFNRLHMHLTDDQGWRIEIKSRPELTSRGAWRTLNRQDSVCLKIASETKDPKFLLPEDRMHDGLYGGFYTQDEMRGIIAYAAIRGIEIVPEIDWPGHSLAILESYPELSCDGKGGSWGKDFSSPLCLGNDEVMGFCKTVLDEIFALFPSEYIHIGGDEVERTEWERCPKCQHRIQSCNLGDTKGLQPWFTRELEQYCILNGKKMAGWDEIVSDGLTTESAVMWWRSWSPASLNKALQEGHPVIVTPSEYYYLAEDQDRNTLAKVYGYEPECGTSPIRKGKVIGIQGNLWSEKAASIECVGERMFPRLFAIAESAWSRAGDKDFGYFMKRLPVHLQKLDQAGWKYRMPDVKGIYDRNVITEGMVTVSPEIPDGAAMYFTTDGSVPDMSSTMYSGPFVIRDSCVLKYRCYNGRGVAGKLCEALFLERDYMPAMADSPVLSDGLLVNWYDFNGESCEMIDKAPIKESFTCRTICVPDDVTGNIGLIFNGYITIPEDGIYQFYTYSDDGSTLHIDGVLTVDNDGLHSRLEKTGQAALRKGVHKFTLRYFDSNGGILEAGMTDSSGNHIPFGKGMLRH